MMIAFVHDMPSGLAVGGAAIHPRGRQGSVEKHNLILPECNIFRDRYLYRFAFDTCCACKLPRQASVAA